MKFMLEHDLLQIVFWYLTHMMYEIVKTWKYKKILSLRQSQVKHSSIKNFICQYKIISAASSVPEMWDHL